MARVLVIDDDQGIRMVLRRILEQAGHEVTEASNGAEGVCAYRQAPAEVVLTNILMPEKDGLEVIRELRQDFPDLKSIALSAHPLYLQAAMDLGALRTLSKPFDSQRLLDTVAELAGGGPQ